MPPDATHLSLEEYRALRATIRERGTARCALAVLALAGWAGLAMAALSLASTALWTLFALLVLAVGFEAVAALHLGVERIGRYLAVFYEGERDGPSWERSIAAFGRVSGRLTVATDPLFTRLFVLASLANLAGAGWLSVHSGPAVARRVVPFAICVVFHAAFLVRIDRVRRYAARQREVETGHFQEIRASPPS